MSVVNRGWAEDGMRVEVRVKLKEEVLDPQGEAIRRVLAGLGYGEVERVRVGKLLLLELVGEDRELLRTRVEAACSEVLANTVIEDFEVRLP